MVDINERYQKDSSIVSREIAGEYILVPIRQNVGDLESIYTLNETAALAWSLIDGQITLSEIAEKIVAEFDVETGQALADILELFTQLEEISAVKKI